MCLKVFVEGDQAEYERLRPAACKLGSAFQKINFLRDMKSDFDERGRVYFPGVDFRNFDERDKKLIEDDIQGEFDEALVGIKNLPKSARFGVYLAYVYYTNLFSKIKKANAERVKQERIRVNDSKKVYLVFESMFKHSFNLL